MVEKLFRYPFLKNQNWAYLWMKILKNYIVSFHYVSSWGLSQYIETKPDITWFGLIYTFLIKKRDLELVLRILSSITVETVKS